MNVPNTLSGPAVAPASGETPEQIILFMHGLGADGEDLISLAGPLQEHFPSAVFVSPNAPQPCDMAPYGFQWFSLQDRSEETLLSEVKTAQPILDTYIDELLAYFNLPPEKLAVIGFSQGTMTALYTLPRRDKAIAAIVGFSGGLIGADTLASEAKSRMPITLIHGDADNVVPFEAMGMSQQALSDNQFDVTAHARPGLGHGIDPEGLEIAINHLKAHLK